MNNIRLLFYFSLVLTLVFGSCGSSMEKANQLFKQEAYSQAAEEYKNVYKDNKVEDKIMKQRAAYLAGDCYLLNHNANDALKWYKRAEKKGMKEPEVKYQIAVSKMRLGNYIEAIGDFKDYQKLNPTDTRTETMLKGCEEALKSIEKSSRYKVESFRPANERRVDDFSPMWGDKREKTLTFTSDRPDGAHKGKYPRTGRNHSDLYSLKKEGRRGKERWGKPEVVEGTETKFNEGSAGFNDRYSQIYITQCNGLDGKDSFCKIYEGRKSGNGFSVDYSKPLPFCKPGYSYGHATLSPDGKTLYFSSDMPGGMAKEGERTMDIWAVTFVRRGRTWSDPVNLGPMINTPGNESFPYMHPDGTLYFSSDYHLGMGGLDIFYSTGEGVEWEQPQNMWAPINSFGDDFGIVMNNEKNFGYFTSDRAKGDDDIYQFSMDPIVLLLEGLVTDCDNGLPISNADVVISNNLDSTKIRLKTDAKGNYETPLKLNAKYEILVSKRSDYYYDAEPKLLSTAGIETSTTFKKNFCLENQCDDVFVLPIYYGLDSAHITTRPESVRVLEELAQKLIKYPRMAIEIGSHTDCRASYDYNRDLSQRRADSAVAYLLSRDINPFRLNATGYGESRLKNECACEGADIVPCNEDQHQENRRTEVTVTSCKFTFDPSKDIDTLIQEAAALGPVSSRYLDSFRIAWVRKNKSTIETQKKEIEDKERQRIEEMQRIRMSKLYDIIDVKERGGKVTILGYVDRTRINFDYNPDALTIKIPQSIVERLLKSGVITLDNFSEGKEKIRFADGTKVTSKNFTLPELKLGDMVFKDLKCKITDDRQGTLGGARIFENYINQEVRDGKLYLQKIKEEDLDKEEDSE